MIGMLEKLARVRSHALQLKADRGIVDARFNDGVNPMSEQHNEFQPSRKRYVQLTLLVWVLLIGIDFFLHAGLFSRSYTQESPFLLPTMEAFLRIPFGYLALLVSTGLLVWIFGRANVKGWRDGLGVGLGLGFAMAFSYTVGLYSISTASTQLLASWFVIQVLEIAIAGVVIGQGLLVSHMRRLTITVLIGVVLLFIITIAMQNLGLSSPMMSS